MDLCEKLANHGIVKEVLLLIQEALECTSGISDEQEKSNALKSISSEIVKLRYWQLAEKIGIQIPQITIRHKCWKQIAENNIKINDWEDSLEKYYEFKNDEAKSFYLKGFVESLTTTSANKNCIIKSFPLLKDDLDSLEKVLISHAQNVIFFNKSSFEIINRLKRTLNIQWAIDIANNFNKN
jgi:type III secretory pathway component EscV